MSAGEVDLSEAIAEQIIRASVKAKGKAKGGEGTKKKDSIKPKEVECCDGEVKFSELFGYSPEEGFDIPVKVFKDEDWDVAVRAHIPPKEEAETYIWPKKETPVAVAALMRGDKQLAIGPTGAGKSSLFRNLCAVMRIPFMRVNFYDQVDPSAIFGMPSVSDGNLEYKDGPIAVLAKHGGVICLDEFSGASADITMSLQYPLEEGGKVYLPDMPAESDERFITPHEWFRIVATDNTELQGDISGRFPGTKVQNTATLDRFQTVFRLNYLSRSDEKTILKTVVPDIPEGIVSDMLKVAELIRVAYEKHQIGLTMSPRTLINWARKTVYWGNANTAFRYAFFERLIPDHQKVVAEFYNKVFDTDIVTRGE